MTGGRPRPEIEFEIGGRNSTVVIFENELVSPDQPTLHNYTFAGLDGLQSEELSSRAHLAAKFHLRTHLHRKEWLEGQWGLYHKNLRIRNCGHMPVS